MSRNLQMAFLLSVVVLLLGCAAPRSANVPNVAPIAKYTPPSAAERQRVQLEKIKFTDGVDQGEGCVIARVYFERVYGMCGVCGRAEDRGDNWYFPCYVGYGGEDKPGISVSKSGCKVSCKSGPEINELAQLMEPSNAVWRSRFSKGE